MRTTIRLPEPLLRRARQKATDEGRTLTSLIEEGLQIVLLESAPSRRHAVQIPVSRAKGGTLPGVDLNRSDALLDLMDER